MYTDESRLECCWEIWVYKRKETSVSPLNRTCLLLAKFWLIPDLLDKPDSVELAYFTWNGEKSHSAFSLCKPKSFIRNNKWLHYGKKFILNRNVTFFPMLRKYFIQIEFHWELILLRKEKFILVWPPNDLFQFKGKPWKSKINLSSSFPKFNLFSSLFFAKELRLFRAFCQPYTILSLMLHM